MFLQNAELSAAFDSNGCLVGLSNLRTGQQWTLNTSAGYRLTVNTSTGDIWKTNQGPTRTLCPNDAADRCITRQGDQLCVVSIHLIGDGTIIVRQTWTIAHGDLTLETSIENNCSSITVTRVVALSIQHTFSGTEPLSLLWPDKEGALYPCFSQQGEALHLSASYPSLLSMQYLALYHSSKSLYFAVHDTACEYKEFAFDADADGIAFFCRQYPFIGAKEHKTLAPTHLAPCGGGWHSCADRYRAFLLSNGFCKSYGKMARSFSAINAYCLTRYSDRHDHVYINGQGKCKDMAKLSQENQISNGTDLTIFIGWHETGFDSRYPDYSFIDDYGGAAAFRQGVEAVHAQGGKVLPYINLHIADTLSNWYSAPHASGQTNGEACAILATDGSLLHEDYGTGLDYVAMCPMASAWQDALVHAAERLYECGADGLWMDQLMEMPSNLCFNKAHGHSTPATAYFEGYQKLLTRIGRAMHAHEEDRFFCCEGVCDAYIGFIDACGQMWARLPGSTPAIAQQITRYSMPSKFFGLPSFAGEPDEPAKYAHAWVFANGMLCNMRNSVIKRYALLAAKHPALYYDGRFMDTLGIGPLPDGISAGVLISPDGTQAAIQLANTNSFDVSLSLTLDAFGTVSSMVNAETDEPLEETSKGWKMTVCAKDVAAVRVHLHPQA